MSTDVDGAAPSLAPEPGDDAGPGDAGWLQQEIRRRAARAGSSGGRHARRGITEPPSTAHEYVPRHGGAPGPATVPPPPPPLPRREPAPAPAGPGFVPPRPAGPVGRRPIPSPPDGDFAPPTTPLTVTPPTFTPPVRPPAAGAGAPTVPRTSETLPGLPPLTPVSSLTGTRPGLPAVRPRAAPGTATAAGPGGPSRPDVLPRRRPRLEPPSGPAAARLLGLADGEAAAPPPAAPPPAAPPPAAPPPAPPRAAAPPEDVLAPPAPDLAAPDLDDDFDDDDDDADGGLLDEDLDADGEVVLWSAGPPPPSLPEQRTAGAVPPGDTPDGAEGPDGGALRGARFPRQDDLGPQRVRVVLSERKGVTRPVRNVVELQESGTVGDLLRGDLIRSQLRVALVFALIGGVVLGALPVLFATVPEVGRLELLGIRVPWLVLGLLVYPFLFGLGWLFTRRAEGVEQEFANKVQDS